MKFLSKQNEDLEKRMNLVLENAVCDAETILPSARSLVKNFIES